MDHQDAHHDDQQNSNGFNTIAAAYQWISGQQVVPPATETEREGLHGDSITMAADRFRSPDHRRNAAGSAEAKVPLLEAKRLLSTASEVWQRRTVESSDRRIQQRTVSVSRRQAGIVAHRAPERRRSIRNALST